ncbi:MAG: hypothetical protein KDD10_01690 [Phaeodactylibacter sp.]|nr:hypothetical protein [Phaeodactylibacter sp.]MCB9295754.1 hypothetical protein [Lewinellaceae bacterium]
MLNLAIPLPNIPGKQDIEIEMTMNGKRQKFHYRVEVYRWADCRMETDNRVDCVRGLVREYDDEWVVYHIGMPTDEYVPLTFIRKEDWAMQHQWLWAGKQKK